MVRVFVAILLSEGIREQLERLQADLGGLVDGVRWVQPANLHLTMKFLGEITDADVARVCDAAKNVARQAEPFDMTVTDYGCFPNRGPVRIVWAGTDEPTGRLQSLYETCEDHLEDIGLARERRPFSPHITIGRVKRDQSGGRIRRHVQDGTFGAGTQSVSSLAVMQSQLSSKGPTYIPLACVDFG